MSIHLRNHTSLTHGKKSIYSCESSYFAYREQKECSLKFYLLKIKIGKLRKGPNSEYYERRLIFRRVEKDFLAILNFFPFK